MKSETGEPFWRVLLFFFWGGGGGVGGNPQDFGSALRSQVRLRGTLHTSLLVSLIRKMVSVPKDIGREVVACLQG